MEPSGKIFMHKMVKGFFSTGVYLTVKPDKESAPYSIFTTIVMMDNIPGYIKFDLLKYFFGKTEIRGM